LVEDEEFLHFEGDIFISRRNPKLVLTKNENWNIPRFRTIRTGDNTTVWNIICYHKSDFDDDSPIAAGNLIPNQKSRKVFDNTTPLMYSFAQRSKGNAGNINQRSALY
jgi:hypothetical protein